jgi:hypothetical protein
MSDESIPPEKRSTALLVRPLLPQEHHTAERYKGGRAILVRLDRTGPPTYREAQASDVSLSGICLHLPYPLVVGNTVLLLLRGRLPAQSATLPAEVTHVAKEGDGTWSVGCAFRKRLQTQTLAALLQAAPPSQDSLTPPPHTGHD